MNDLPPKQEKIVLVREYKQLNEVILKKDLWREMEFQMQLTGMTLDMFITKSLEFFIQDLKIEQDNEKMYLSCNEYQLFPSETVPPVRPVTVPVPIRPNPVWYYHIDEKEGK